MNLGLKTTESSEERKCIASWAVHRRDTYGDSLNQVIDCSIEEVAKLVALKANLQERILEQNQRYRKLLSEVSNLNLQENSLKCKLSMAEEG